MTWRDRVCLTAIIAAGLYAWFAFPWEMGSVLLTLAVLAMLALSVKALLSGAKRLGQMMKTRASLGGRPRSQTTHSLRIER